jgi:membrane protein implicated in regulation of membrane protease activity
MIDLNTVLDELAIQLSNIELTNSVEQTVRFNVGDETWKYRIEYDSETGDCVLVVKRREF